MSVFALPNRALLTVSGGDASDFLQGLITTDLDPLEPDEARPGALLTPQGKILFDFLVTRDGAALRLETAAGQAEGLLKRLTLYKLRAAVSLALDPSASVLVSFEEVDGRGYDDVRFSRAGQRVRRIYVHKTGSAAESSERYDEARIAAGIVESGSDYALQDVFPHDVLLDLNGGLSFKKGCYVGQEVVSRMQHRGTARRRVVTVAGEAPLPPTGTALLVGGRPIGALGTIRDRQGLAIVRIDKAGAALAAGVPVLAGEVPVTLALPGWTGLDFPQEADEATA